LSANGRQPENLIAEMAKSQASVPQRQMPLKKLDIPMPKAKSLDGIISYLTNKHGGNVHDKGVVTLTATQGREDSVKNLVDLTSPSRFVSNTEWGQWVCWDFGGMRVRPTHYTMNALGLNSWVVEASLDGENWTEIDRKTNRQVFSPFGVGSFTIMNPEECRFIRLTQNEKTFDSHDFLWLFAVEWFGTLSE
jgi:hypothetical protein